jgi:23S rRNA pseudouridine1911/1915/1917 synthase
MATRRAQVPRDLAGPLDRAVRSLFEVSWGQARAWIARGKVRHAGAVATEPTARVREGDAVEVDEQARAPRVGELSDGDVVFADAHVIVVEKPPGLSTVPFDDTEVDTLDARVRAWLSRTRRASQGMKSARPSLGVVHRIDKETSGLVVFARTWLAKQSLSSQFRRHTVIRRYVALVRGVLAAPRTIRSYLLVDRGDGLRGSARGTPPPQAREAITHVEPLEVLEGATQIACRLETGRTHQIRIHLSEAGHPLLGERVYIRGASVGPFPQAPRLMLHAAELGFLHPATEREVRWESPLPDDVREVVERLRVRRR